MTENPVIQIKKYPNRRYYDASRSRHVTLEEVCDLVRQGHDVAITDSRTGTDITNQVLMQILLERDHLKLDLMPSTFLHWMLRSNRQALRDAFERLFGPFMQMLAASQKQFDAYLRQTTGTPLTTPLDWANRLVEAFSPSMPRRPDETATASSEPVPPEVDPREDAIDDLRRQMRTLTQQIEKLNAKRKSRSS